MVQGEAAKPATKRNVSMGALNGRWFRPAVIMVVGLIVVACFVISNHRQNAPYAGAKTAADAFLKAYSQCDAAGASKYYPAFQDLNSDSVKAYQKQCKKGMYSFSFSKQLSVKTKRIETGTVKTVSLLYTYTDSRSGQPGQLAVDMVTDPNGSNWIVKGMSPANANTTGTSLHI